MEGMKRLLLGGVCRPVGVEGHAPRKREEGGKRPRRGAPSVLGRQKIWKGLTGTTIKTKDALRDFTQEVTSFAPYEVLRGGKGGGGLN